jgi:hypothetical protein
MVAERLAAPRGGHLGIACLQLTPEGLSILPVHPVLGGSLPYTVVEEVRLDMLKVHH